MDSLSRVSSLVETARDLTLEAARDAAASRRTVSRPLPPAALKKLLDSRREAEVLDGLRRVMALFYSNQSALPYFTAVVKNIASPNTEIKKLVYAFLIQHAEAAPDTALLAINTIQKGMSDSNARTRALALRTMSSIRVSVISQIVALGIKRGAGDMSPIVRRTAALAIPKCYRMDPSQSALLEEQIGVLLGDRQYYVAGAAVHAFLEVCPERLDLIHPHWRGLVKKLVDMDEWGQLSTLELMVRYCRKCFPRRTKKVRKGDLEEKKNKAFYEDEETSTPEEMVEVPVLDPDLELLLKSIQPLLQSRNSAVIIAVARCYLYLGTTTYLSLLAGPLMSILRAGPDIASQALPTIADLIRQHPTSFLPYTTHFLLRASDSPLIVTTKLTILSLLFPHVSTSIRSLILTDLAHHTSSSDATLVRAAVLAIGRCASAAPTPALRSRCLALLLTHLSSPDATLVAASLDEIRVLIQRDPSAHSKTIVRLAKHLDALKAPKARAAIIWLVGEFAATPGSVQIAADVWRILLQGFADETVEVQSQILLLAAKVYLHDRREREKSAKDNTDVPNTEILDSDDETSQLVKMLHHTFLLARYAHSFQLRDRTRYLRNLLLDVPSTDLAALLLLTAKPSPRADDPAKQAAPSSDRKTAVGSASWLLGIDIRGAQNVPAWTTIAVGAAERNGDEAGASVSSRPTSMVERSGTPVGGGSGKSNGAERTTKTLDQWLDEDEVEGEEEDEEEDSGETESDSESAEYETDSEETDSDDDGEEDQLVKS
ncbi:ARM repeat-containing protein [Microthyrium microscopicum]|uniref:ARM repeat-containing protein n=1 Tax=Microthyrium microscopicum TaxID=703497 RepID=A0A6A6UKD1_9PEZI|nr:ARM repeat-containing protein [Microthyrium microscopicum]